MHTPTEKSLLDIRVWHIAISETMSNDFALIHHLVPLCSVLWEAEFEAQSLAPPTRTQHLFDESTCEWTNFYTDESILDMVFTLYAADYSHFSWYHIHKWKNRLQQCLHP